jgi:hypothetical protein
VAPFTALPLTYHWYRYDVGGTAQEPFEAVNFTERDENDMTGVSRISGCLVFFIAFGMDTAVLVFSTVTHRGQAVRSRHAGR